MKAKTLRGPVLLFLVRERDDLGRPKKLEVVYDEEKVDLRDPKNREFVTAVGMESAVWAPKTRGKA